MNAHTLIEVQDVTAAKSESAMPRPQFGIRLRSQLASYGFLLPWLVGFFALTLGPALSSLYLSFTNYDLVDAPNWVGLENYARIAAADPRFDSAVTVTFTFVLLAVPLKLAFALLLALALNRGLRGLTLFRAVFYLPSLLGSSVAIAVLWRQVFAGDGLLNQLLMALFGFDGPSWISTPDTALYTLVLLSVWQFGSPMIIFLAGLRQIPHDMYEAASIDGASPARQFFKITLPLLTPVVFFNAVIQTIEAFKAFTSAFVVSNGSGGPIDSTLFYTLYLYQEAFVNFRIGYASALAWVLVLIICIFTALAFYTARYWVHYDD